MADFIDPPFGTIPTSSVASGIFNPGAAISIDLAVRLVNKCVELAQQKDVDFGSKIDAVVAWLEANVPAAITAPTVASPSAITFTGITASDVTAGSIIAPTPTEPSMTLADTGTALVFNNFSSQVAPIIANALAKFTDFMTTYFPDNDTTYGDAEAYLQSAIENKTQGIVPAEIRAAILLSDRDRLLAEESRAIADLYEAPVVRRHRFPSGAQQAAARRIAQQTLDAIAASSRAVAIKDFELSHQTALESVKMAISARQAALAAATQYIATLVAQSYSTGAGITGTAHSAEVAKIQAAYHAYAERIHAAELALKAVQADETLSFEAGKANLSAALEKGKANLSASLDASKANLGATLDVSKSNVANTLAADKLNLDTKIRVMDFRVRTLMSEAEIIGHEVTAMLNNLRVGSSMTYGHSISESLSV